LLILKIYGLKGISTGLEPVTLFKGERGYLPKLRLPVSPANPYKKADVWKE